MFTLPIDALRDPPPYLRVREVKEWYVDYLAEMLLDEKGDHEDLTAPLLVIASATKSDFRPKSANSYTYEVCCWQTMAVHYQGYRAIKCTINIWEPDTKVIRLRSLYD